MWITKLLVEKLNKEDKKIDEKISEGTIQTKMSLKEHVLSDFLKRMTDACLFIGAIQIVRGTIRLITKKVNLEATELMIYSQALTVFNFKEELKMKVIIKRGTKQTMTCEKCGCYFQLRRRGY